MTKILLVLCEDSCQGAFLLPKSPALSLRQFAGSFGYRAFVQMQYHVICPHCGCTYPALWSLPILEESVIGDAKAVVPEDSLGSAIGSLMPKSFQGFLVGKVLKFSQAPLV